MIFHTIANHAQSAMSHTLLSKATLGIIITLKMKKSILIRSLMTNTDLINYLQEHADDLRETIAQTDGKYQKDYLDGCLDTTELIPSIVTPRAR